MKQMKFHIEKWSTEAECQTHCKKSTGHQQLSVSNKEHQGLAC